ncbi:tyrosine-type recombinase/integrase [Maricaulaceae bacterium EIL42A08]|nr:tyrosine-type recombinase/integrase [Maricaulaceae bacterium EIL42A08]
MRTKDQHLKLKGKTFYYVRDVPKDVRDQFGKSRIEVSLKTRKRDDARKLRDAKSRELERSWHLIRAGRKAAESIDTTFIDQAAYERGEFTYGDLEVTPLLDEITDQIDALAMKHAKDGSKEALDKARDYVQQHTEEGRKLAKLVDQYHGHLSYSDAGESFLSQKPNLASKTKAEYRKAFELADKSLPPIKNLTRQSLQHFANTQGKTKAAATVNKALSAIRGVVNYQGEDISSLIGVSANSSIPVIERKVWTPDALRAVLAASSSKWLAKTVEIALFTGAREGAIARMSYDSKNDWLLFPRQKSEGGDRYVPCPDALRETVKDWVAHPKSASAISGQFTEAKKAAGFDGPEHKNKRVFHSLRHMTTSRFSDLGVPEHIAARIVGHKTQTMTYGHYGSKGDVEALREWINKLDWSDVFEKPTVPGVKPA